MTTTDIPLGTRVVLRYRLPPGDSHSLTDVIGILVETEPITVRRKNGEVVQVPADRVVALKALGPPPRA